MKAPRRTNGQRGRVRTLGKSRYCVGVFRMRGELKGLEIHLIQDVLHCKVRLVSDPVDADAFSHAQACHMPFG